MSLNPFTQLEKLINEHGSANILRDHVTFLRDKFSILEKENSALKAENATLQQQVSELEKLNKELRAINQNQQDGGGVSDASRQNFIHNEALGEIEVKILIAISNKEGTAQDICSALSIAGTLIDFHLEEMKAKGLITSQRVPLIGEWWLLQQAGRKYLIENKLI